MVLEGMLRTSFLEHPTTVGDLYGHYWQCVSM